MFHRDMSDEIKPYLEERQALFILGSRQAGKTTLMKILMESLPKSRCKFLDMEKISDRKLIEDGADEFIRFLKGDGFDLTKKNYIFIDEIQLYPEFSSFIKLLVDYHSNSVKLILSGSSAAQIQMQFKDSLAGRKYVFHLHPLSFREFLLFKNKEQIAEKLIGPFYLRNKDNLKFYRHELLPLLEEYILFGGYPEVVKMEENQRKIRLLAELMDAYIVKDIKWLFNLKDVNKFNHLIKYLAVTNGQLISVQNIAKEVRLSRQTVKSYIKILEDTFITKRISPYFNNKTKEFRKMPKVYFMDTGLRNSLVESFVSLKSRPDAGALFENFVFTQLIKKKGLTELLYFWRTQQKQEVDFIIKQDDKLYPLESKTKLGHYSHLRKFMKEQHCKRGFIASLKEEYNHQRNLTILPGYLV